MSIASVRRHSPLLSEISVLNELNTLADMGFELTVLSTMAGDEGPLRARVSSLQALAWQGDNPSATWPPGQLRLFWHAMPCLHGGNKLG